MENKLKYIEFFGAPGVGKTTLYKSVVSNLPKLYLGSDSFKKGIIKKTILNQYKGYKSQLIKIGFFTPLVSKLLYKSKNQPLDKLLIETFLDKNEGFLKKANTRIFSSNSSEIRKISASNMLLNTVKDHSLFKLNHNSNKTLLMDEFFCQRLYTQFSEFGNQTEEKIVEEYFQNMPLPIALIYIESNSKKITERVLKRKKESGKINHMHNNLNKEELFLRCKNYTKYSRLAIDILLHKKIPLLQLKGDDIKQNMCLVKEFLINQNV